MSVENGLLMSLFRFIALLEGLSLLLLLFVAMPLKYGFGMPEFVSWAGRAHGGLFIAFNILLFYFVSKKHLPETHLFFGFMASLFPFGTFIYTAKMLPKCSR